MNKKNIILVCYILSMLTANAETMKIEMIENRATGEKIITNIEYGRSDAEFTIDTFDQADKNSDGCIDKSEARDQGILNFSTFAKKNSSCLNSDEYEKAMKSE